MSGQDKDRKVIKDYRSGTTYGTVIRPDGTVVAKGSDPWRALDGAIGQGGPK